MRNRLLIGDRHVAIADLLPHEPILDLPRLRDRPLDWSRFTPDFLASRDRAIRRAIDGDRPTRDPFGGRLGADPLAQARAARKGRRRPVRNRDAATKAHLNALSWLVRHGFDERDEAYALDSVADLVSVEIIDRAVEAYVERARASDVLLSPDKTATRPVTRTRLSAAYPAGRVPSGKPLDLGWAVGSAEFL